MMDILISGLFLAVLVIAVFYLRLNLMTGTTGITLALILWSVSGIVSATALVLTWLCFAPLALFINIKPARKKWVSYPMLRFFRKAMPEMSQTERDALEAGTVWWDGELFSGAPRWEKLMKTPVPTLNPEELAFLNGPTETLCQMVNDWEITQEHLDLPPNVWQYIKDHGFFSMIIPKKYGGLEFSAYAHSQVVMKIASRSTTASVTVMVPNSLGPAELLLRYGTEEQKNHYLPRLAKGQEIPCFALTGPEAGSDASSIPDTGIVCHQKLNGKDTLGIRLNWDKRYITLAPVATVLGLAFKLFDPDHLLGDTKELGITLALIPTKTPGVNIGRRHFPLNMAFQNGPTWGENVFVPIDWIIGGAPQIGKGWRMLMECLAAGRAISLPALSTGAGKIACRATGAYARIRKQFKLPIGRFEGVEEPLARIAGLTYLMDSARIMTLGALDMGEQPSVISAILKYHLTEYMRQVINDAMDIQGGSAICMGPRNLLARCYQGVPISITVEGANILTRTLIIFGQGAIRCHPFILKELQAAADTSPQAEDVFDQAFFAHLGWAVSNAMRAWVTGLTGALWVHTPDVDKLSRYYMRQFSRMSAAFSFLADMSMLILGGTLKRKEKLSGRLADMLSGLYLGSAAIKRYVDTGCRPEDAVFLKWACNTCLFNIQQAMLGLLSNFPIPVMGKILRWIIFPLGQQHLPNNDQLGHQLAEILLQPSEIRDELTEGIYLPTKPEEPLAQLESTLKKVVAAESIEKKVYSAVKSGKIKVHDEMAMVEAAYTQQVITAEEADTLRSAIEARKETIQVDHFPADFWHHREQQIWHKTMEPKAGQSM